MVMQNRDGDMVTFFKHEINHIHYPFLTEDIKSAFFGLVSEKTDSNPPQCIFAYNSTTTDVSSFDDYVSQTHLYFTQIDVM